MKEKIRHMQKELLTIEFRYHDKPDSIGSVYRERKITVGIFDTLEEAIEEGNRLLEILQKYFEVRSDDKFSKNFLFGTPRRLVSNCCYPTRGISYFAKIEPLRFDELSETIREVFEAAERYKAYREREECL